MGFYLFLGLLHIFRQRVHFFRHAHNFSLCQQNIQDIIRHVPGDALQVNL